MALSMEQLIADFPAQLETASGIGPSFGPLPEKAALHSVLICGLGGSGIGGSIISELVCSTSPWPVNISKDYDLPAFAGKNTLVIISSYSGNTEETLACMEEALKRKCSIICITSGGKVMDAARTHSLPAYILPGGMPPRSCLGYSLTQLVKIFAHYGLTGNTWNKEIHATLTSLKKNQVAIRSKAKEIAVKLNGKYPVIYSTSHWEGICIRFRQQLNENAKILCSHHVLPEMNHNELVGWRTKDEHLAVITFRDRNEYTRNDLRWKLLLEVVQQYTPNITEIYAEGNSRLEKALYLIHLGDWISVELAALRGVDAIEVKVIDHLKSELGKH
ncbi:MAG: bifunctional phosphoglucose/phosphomannose isomerase [Bacteroidia bacterium]|nr:bifunctional phosphoglucose/phosphomannose isomerase [Bacteroidia bacterium]